MSRKALRRMMPAIKKIADADSERRVPLLSEKRSVEARENRRAEHTL